MAKPKKPSPRQGVTLPRLLSPKQQEKARSYLDQIGSQPIFQITGVIIFIVAVVTIITGGFNLHGSSLTPDLVDKRASRDYKSSRDFIYIEKDLEATDARRREVLAQLPPVYDWQEDRGEQIRDQVHQSFDNARQKLREALQAQQKEQGPQPSPPAPATEQDLIKSATAPQRVDASASFVSTTFEDFPTPLTQAELVTLAELGFSAEVESTFNALIYKAMSELIVKNTRVIDENRERGIYLRRLRGDAVLVEYHLLDVRQDFKEIKKVQADARIAAERQFSTLDDPQARATLEEIAARLISANTEYNEELTLTQRARAEQAIEEVIASKPIKKGQVIVARGDLISDEHVRIWGQMREEEALLDITQTMLGLVLFLLLILVILYQYGRYNIDQLKFSPKDIAFLSTSTLFFLLLVKLGQVTGMTLTQQIPAIPLEAWLFALPIGGFGMLIRLVLRSEHAILSSIAMAAMCAMIMDEMLVYFIFTMCGCLIGAHFVRQVKHRLALMWSGVVVGAINTLVISTALLLRGELLQADSLIILTMGFGGGVLSGFIVSSLLPIIEATFGYTTDIKLLELSNLNHPLMRELILHAPGSYHHSMMVGSLCEAAADQIGCNALLSRVGAYYHDIGKAKNPGYFAENQKYGENPHDKLKPNMSALIIKAHVKDGAEMARQYGLPKEIVAFIEQHHGTSLIAYFYHRAKELEDPDIPEVNEKDYRYPGPKPQTRETAICLLADGIEAASKAMPNKTPARLKGLVQKMINKAFTDGQLDECDLTLKDLNAIASAFTRILTGIYHHRPEYPGSKKASRDSTPKNQSARTKTPSTPLHTTSSQTPQGSEKDTSNEHRNSTTGERKAASAKSEAEREPDREERASLPRLGPS